MNTGELIFETLKLILPPAFVLAGMWVVIRELQKKQEKTALMEIRSETLQKVLPLRLNAYERAILFLERISPENLILRCDASGKPAAVFHRQLQAEVRSEFEHNMSQQLYISPEGWTELVKAKEHILSLIHLSARDLAPGAQGVELGRKILEATMVAKTSPAHQAISVLRGDMQKMFKF